MSHFEVSKGRKQEVNTKTHEAARNGLNHRDLRGRFAAGCAYASVFLFLLSYSAVNGQGLPVVLPQAAGMSGEKLNQIDELVEKDIADKKLPGAVVLIGRRERSSTGRHSGTGRLPRG